MKRLKHTILPFLIASLSLFTLQSCDNDTPAEELGEGIEDAADEVGDAIDDATD